MILWNVLRPSILKIKRSKVLSLLVCNTFYYIMRLFFMTYVLDVRFAEGVEVPFHKNCGVCYFWHQQIVAALFFFFKMGSTQNCVVSSSVDGLIAGNIVERLGFNVVYGSAFKNPIQVTRQSLKILSEGQQLCIVGDGSRGPAFELKRGVIYLAEKAVVPLFFIECSSSFAFTVKKSWDKFQIPLPFSRIIVRIHKQISTEMASRSSG